MVIRFPQSRIKRVRYNTKRWKPSEQNWNKKVAIEYENNAVGSFQGNFDKPICDVDLRCGNWGLSFGDFVNYRHEPINNCKIFDINRTKYKQLKNSEKIKAYFIKESSETINLSGPASSLDTQNILLTCPTNKCIFPCLCKTCVLRSKECSEHSILHPNFFDSDEDFFLVRNGYSFNINVNEGSINYSNSMDKGY